MDTLRSASISQNLCFSQYLSGDSLALNKSNNTMNTSQCNSGTSHILQKCPTMITGHRIKERLQSEAQSALCPKQSTLQSRCPTHNSLSSLTIWHMSCSKNYTRIYGLLHGTVWLRCTALLSWAYLSQGMLKAQQKRMAWQTSSPNAEWHKKNCHSNSVHSVSSVIFQL